MKQTQMIHIDISGPVGSGKSASLSSIKNMLEAEGYCVAVPDRAERNNPSAPIERAATHEKPCKDEVVFVLKEFISA